MYGLTCIVDIKSWALLTFYIDNKPLEELSSERFLQALVQWNMEYGNRSYVVLADKSEQRHLFKNSSKMDSGRYEVWAIGNWSLIGAIPVVQPISG